MREVLPLCRGAINIFYSPTRLGNHSFRLSWFCLIIDVISTWAKFLLPSGYCIVISCIFILHTANVFSCFCSVMAHFKLINCKLLNESILHIHLCSFQITHKVKQCTVCQHTIFMIQPITAGNNQNLDHLGQVIYMWKTGIHQNIAKPLTHLIIYCIIWY